MQKVDAIAGRSDRIPADVPAGEPDGKGRPRGEVRLSVQSGRGSPMR